MDAWGALTRLGRAAEASWQGARAYSHSHITGGGGGGDITGGGSGGSAGGGGGLGAEGEPAYTCTYTYARARMLTLTHHRLHRRRRRRRHHRRRNFSAGQPGLNLSLNFRMYRKKEGQQQLCTSSAGNQQLSPCTRTSMPQCPSSLMKIYFKSSKTADRFPKILVVTQSTGSSQL